MFPSRSPCLPSTIVALSFAEPAHPGWVAIAASSGLSLQTLRFVSIGVAYAISGLVVGGLFGSKTFVWSLVLSLPPLFVPYLAVRVEFFWPLWMGAVAHYFASFLDRRARIV